MATKKPTKRLRKKKFVALLTNRTDRRDNETMEVWAYDSAEAETIAKQKMSDRFSYRGILTAKEARSNWYW